MVKELKRPGKRRRRRLLRLPGRPEKFLWPELKAPLREAARVAWTLQDVKDRMLYVPGDGNGALPGGGRAHDLHDDANIGSIFGIGFPAWTGGALQFIYGQGVDAFAAARRRAGREVRSRLRTDARSD
jgi:3-hydroxyacyl-CoA dehydrogenase/enoyl-CoA hydratase/3-hydroxybutyryl-CoA epimerase